MIRSILTVSTFLLLLEGCDLWVNDGGKVCTLIGCSDGLTVNVQAANQRFAAGRYNVSIGPAGTDGDLCYFVVSNDPARCTSGHCVSEENCNAIYLVGYNEPDRVSILYPVQEGNLTLKIEKDGAKVAETMLKPVYETIRPNGPDCGPACRVSSIQREIK